MAEHDGHRKRLRQRFLQAGIDGFDDLALLELLLQYAIPRKDTNPLAHRLLSPRRHVDKTYLVRADRPFDGADEAAFAAGMVLRDGLHCLPARLERLDCPEEALVTIQEGKYHQIKRMVASQYKQVVYLKRLSMGALKLDPALEKGAWRYLTPAECAALRDAGD